MVAKGVPKVILCQGYVAIRLRLLIVSHDFDMVKPTLPPGKVTMVRKKRTINLSKIKGFYYGPKINNVKHGFMTCNMVNICVEKKFPNFSIFAKIENLSCMPKFPGLQ